MTILPLLADRQAKNIDTHERAIVFAAFLLRKANTASDNSTINSAKYKNAIRITTSEAQNSSTGEITANIVIEAKFPYSSSTALGMGGNFIENILPFSNYDPGIDDIPVLIPNEYEDGFFNEPLFINSLERFFAYHCMAWQKKLLADNQLGLFNKIKINFFEEDSIEPSLKINVVIPYDLAMYQETRNLLKAITTPEPIDNTTRKLLVFDTLQISDGIPITGILLEWITESSNMILTHDDLSYFAIKLMNEETVVYTDIVKQDGQLQPLGGIQRTVDDIVFQWNTATNLFELDNDWNISLNQNQTGAINYNIYKFTDGKLYADYYNNGVYSFISYSVYERTFTVVNL